MSIDGAIETHAAIAVDEIKNLLGDKWEGLTPEQRVSAVRSAKRVVELEWEQRVNHVDVTEDLAFVTATVGEFKMAGEIALHDAFWKGVNKALEALGSFLVGAGKSLIPGLGDILGGIDLSGLIDG